MNCCAAASAAVRLSRPPPAVFLRHSWLDTPKSSELRKELVASTARLVVPGSLGCMQRRCKPACCCYMYSGTAMLTLYANTYVDKNRHAARADFIFICCTPSLSLLVLSFHTLLLWLRCMCTHESFNPAQQGSHSHMPAQSAKPETRIASCTSHTTGLVASGMRSN